MGTPSFEICVSWRRMRPAAVPPSRNVLQTQALALGATRGDLGVSSGRAMLLPIAAIVFLGYLLLCAGRVRGQEGQESRNVSSAGSARV